MKNSVLPRTFWPLVWSVDVKKLDLQKNQRYIVHQLLHYGDLDAFVWLKETYSLPTLQKVFLNTPDKVYTERSLYFVSNFLLGLKNKNLPKDRYVSMAS